MQKFAVAILLFACLALLVAQSAGTHFHIDSQGDQAGLHQTHVHGLDHGGEHFQMERDLPVLEKPGMAWLKLLPLPVALVVLLLAELWVCQRFWPHALPHSLPRRRSRWRPPLRAPPAVS